MMKKKLITLALGLVVTAPTLSIAANSTKDEHPMQVAVAGEWTKCIAWINGQGETNIVGGTSKRVCYYRAKKCANGRQYKATYYSNPVVINAPYKRCRTR